MDRFIDLRSDTVTKPTPEMRKAMFEAAVGDDVFGEDPTINALQEKVAHLLGKEAAIFVASGTMGNQLSIKAQTQPGDEVMIEAGGHAMNFEGGAGAVLSAVQFFGISGQRGIFDAPQVEAAIRVDDVHYPVSRLVVIENTHNRGGGTIFPLQNILRIREVATRNGLRMHMDGARLWNACVASGISPKEYAAPFDSVSVCLSKGLGCPAGSLVAGSQDFVKRVHRFRKMVGGGMRQIGFLAAAGIYALDHHIHRLEEDHDKAKKMAQGLARIKNLLIRPEEVETNILFFDVSPAERTAQEVAAALRKKGVLVHPTSRTRIRCVAHLDVSFSDIDQALKAIEGVMKS
ncbi:MAG TPA: GntG family PLP-dependent aldolase [Thermodesulfobacteriota bacterium]|nr:GntG family PLP-dependent aldolase [Thermodesulfobacteriota bacterium]